MVKYLAFVFMIVCCTGLQANPIPVCDQICGKWLSGENKLVIQVYKDGDEFRAKIVSFKCEANEVLEECTDTKNPDPALRTRKIVGMNVLSGLKYMPDSKTWEDGMIYDSHNGRDWNASAYVGTDGLLKVKGYWHFKFIGRTMAFKRLNSTNEVIAQK